MKDPYQILGINRNASIEEIKKAYRELAKKYHPDNYVGNELADLAAEKMKEINEAYDAVTKEKERGAGNGSWNGGTGTGGSPRYGEIRSAIMRDDLNSAQVMLDAISDRDAEWFFLLGSVQYRRGWFDEAASNINRACQMDPGNGEYKQAQTQMRGGAGVFRQPNTGYGRSSACDPCTCCAGLMCADCLCDCC